ncbi:MAG: 4Fe-4S dicluster domain-containing protein [Marinilabiliales bacterium]|nr:MAG: 4Fe-4S dicluster domain-containing protein [Marinilabiliales bacterium]
MVKIEVNNKIVRARKGETIMSALQSAGIKIPSICSMKDFTPTGACRMCVVEVEGHGGLVPSCSQPVNEWMKIKTHSPRVVRSRKTIVELLLSNHPDDCLYCERNGNCELQTLAEELNVRERRIMGKKNRYKLDHSSPSIVRDPAKCILCGRCVRVCEDKMAVFAIDFVNRGNRTVIGTAYDKDLNFSSCINCGQCIMVCPTGALYEKDGLQELEDALHNPEKTVVAQYESSVSVSLAEEFGIRPGKDMGGIINAVLRKIGFDGIFDTSGASDIAALEMAAELTERKKRSENVPVVTGSCPAWVKFAEQWYPDLLDHMSSCKSPQQILGTIIKTHYPEKKDIDPGKIFSVAITSCTARKFETQRAEMTRKGISDIDCVLTTRELAKLIRLYGVDIDQVEAEVADEPYGMPSSAGKLFGAAGGMSEAVIRSLPHINGSKELAGLKFQELRGIKGRKEARIKIGKSVYRFAVVSGLSNALPLVEGIRSGDSGYDFVEIMACAGGCINGGGQPIGAGDAAIRARMKALYSIDEKETIRVPYKNPAVRSLYNDYLGEPGSDRCKSLFYTKYSERKVLL